MKAKRSDPDLGTPEPETSRPLAYTTERFAELIQGPGGTSISERTVRDWCKNRVIRGARKAGNRWLIPATALDQLLDDPPPDKILPFHLKS